MSDPDLRKLLDPLAAVLAARPKYRTVPARDGVPEHVVAYVDPVQLPLAVVTPDGMIDVAAYMALVHGALGRFADLELRTVVGSATLAPTIDLRLTSTREVRVDWTAAPAAPVRGAIARVDASVVAQGRVRAEVKDGSVTDTGCTVVLTVSGVVPVVVNTALPLTVTATGIYLNWLPYGGT